MSSSLIPFRRQHSEIAQDRLRLSGTINRIGDGFKNSDLRSFAFTACFLRMIAAEGYGGQVGPAFSVFSALPAFAAITKALVS